jgi:hypothetical protein
MNATKRLLVKKNFMKVLLLPVLSLFSLIIQAQTNKDVSSFRITADLVSCFVWRGSLATSGPTPNFQPTMAYAKGNFEIGAWGSTDFAGSYKEADLYGTFTTGPMKLGLTDYNWNLSEVSYFNYKNSGTGHRLEGTVGFSGTETFPIAITWNTMFYGLDKKFDDSTKQAFSTYIELGYTKGAASIFFGFTPWAGFYNNYGISAFNNEKSKKSFSVVNIGASVTKALKITDSFSLPLKATLVINPSASYSRSDYIHLVFGITF